MAKLHKPNLPPCPEGFHWKLLPHNAIIKEHDVVIYGNEVSYSADPISHIGFKCSVTLGRVYRKFPIQYRYFRHRNGYFQIELKKHKVLRYDQSNHRFDFMVELNKFDQYPHFYQWEKHHIASFVEAKLWVEMTYDDVVRAFANSKIEKNLEELRSKIEQLKADFDKSIHLLLLDVDALDFDLFFPGGTLNKSKR